MTKPRMPRADEPVGKGNPFVHKRSRAAEDAVLAWLAKGYSLGHAAEQAGVARQTVLGWRKDPAFAARYDEAIERGTDVLEDEARRRAVEGVDRPVFQGGECVGHVREFSDNLMTILLGGRRDKYRRQKVEHSGPDGGPIQQSVEVEFVGVKK